MRVIVSGPARRNRWLRLRATVSPAVIGAVVAAGALGWALILLGLGVLLPALASVAAWLATALALRWLVIRASGRLGAAVRH